jgi:neurotransmitter:Na+ symporter, NSS family
MNENREKLASRIGFIFLSAGCAIGLGNVWRFPYIAGQNGGGAFVALYLVALALIGLPILLMEFTTGRAAQRSIARLHETLTPEKKAWRVHGLLGFCGNILLMMFYTTVTGWMLIYFVRMVSGAFDGLAPDAVGAAFGGMLGSPGVMSVAMVLVTVAATAVCVVGLQKGVERVTKWLMLCLLVLIVVLAANSVVLDLRNSGGAGLRFYFVPDLARMKSVGVVKVVTEAMNHAFFTLSLGIGAMSIFGSYIGRDRTLLGESLHVCVLDTLVAVSAGVIIIPACFAYGVHPGQGPGLIFATLPNVFNNMPLGRLWGALFFVFMSCAALTTVIAVFENILACLRDFFGWTRRTAGLVTGVALLFLALPCLLGFNVLSGFQPFGAGSCVLDLEDFLVSNLILPLGGIAFALYCCHRFGWGWKNFLAEANAGTGPKFPNALRVYCAYVLPVFVVVIFTLGLLDKFATAK